MWSTARFFSGATFVLIYINDFRLCLSNAQSGHFADDTYVFGSEKSTMIETFVNYELSFKMAKIEQIIVECSQN